MNKFYVKDDFEKLDKTLNASLKLQAGAEVVNCANDECTQLAEPSYFDPATGAYYCYECFRLNVAMY